MAGHSQFKNIMHRKGKQDAVRAKAFSKLSREITVAAKAGLPDPDANARLRLAIQNARAESMPKDNIERAIKKASGGDAETFDNVRSLFAKYGGNLGESGSVAFMFTRVGEIVYPGAKASGDAMLEAGIDVGADDVVSDKSGHTVTCAFESIGEVSSALAKAFGDATSVKIVWKPQTMAPVDFEKAESLMKLVDSLDEDDDVQVVFSNADIPDDVMAKLNGE